MQFGDCSFLEPVLQNLSRSEPSNPGCYYRNRIDLMVMIGPHYFWVFLLFKRGLQVEGLRRHPAFLELSVCLGDCCNRNMRPHEQFDLTLCSAKIRSGPVFCVKNQRPTMMPCEEYYLSESPWCGGSQLLSSGSRTLVFLLRLIVLSSNFVSYMGDPVTIMRCLENL